MPPEKRSKKHVPTETDQEENHHDKDNRISHTPEPSQITDQERRTKVKALYKARAEKAAHTPEPEEVQQDAHEEDDDDDEAVDREPEDVQQKIQQQQKEKERCTNQLQAKRKASKKLEKLN
jgi:transcription termination factor NusB